MRSLPRAVLQLFADLPEGQPLRVVLNTNGRGEWKAEVLLFKGSCPSDEVLSLATLLQAEQQMCESHLTKMST